MARTESARQAIGGLETSAAGPVDDLSGATRRRAGMALDVTGLVLIHWIMWTWVGVALRSNLDEPGDMVEAYAWGQQLAWGYAKHPPLAGWIAGLWFRVAPTTHFGYALLAALVSTIGLVGVWFLARRVLSRDWALLAVACVAVTPGFTSLALRFNCNSVSLATWPWAMVAFLALMERPGLPTALAFGLSAALALLGKYYAGVLLLSLLLGSLWVEPWRRRWTGPWPYVAAACTAVLLLPHIDWLQTHPGPVAYARAAARESLPQAWIRSTHFLRSQLAFLLPAWALLLVCLVGPNRIRALGAGLATLVRPWGHPLWSVAVLPVCITSAASLLMGARSASVWGLPMAAPLVVLMVERVSRDHRFSPGRMGKGLIVAWSMAGLAAPVVWWISARQSDPSVTAPREELALRLTQLWQAHSGQPLPLVGGTPVLAASTSFYSPDHPRTTISDDPHEALWLDLPALRLSGGFVVCAESDGACLAALRSAGLHEQWLEVAKDVRGWQFRPQSFAVSRVAAPEPP